MTKSEFFTHCVMTIGPPAKANMYSPDFRAHLEAYWEQARLAGAAHRRLSYGEWYHWWEKNHAADQP